MLSTKRNESVPVRLPHGSNNRVTREGGSGRRSGGVDDALSQMSGVSASGSARTVNSNDDRRRNHKAASNRKYRSKTSQMRSDSDDESEREQGRPKQTNIYVVEPAPKAPVVEKPKRPVYDQNADTISRKLFMKTDASLHGERMSWWDGVLRTFLRALRNTVMFLLYASIVGIPLAWAYDWMCPVVECDDEVVDTEEWENGASQIFRFTVLDYPREINNLEVNAMAHSGFNSYREAPVSIEVLAWLSKNKMGKPSAFTQQQYADLCLKEFSGRAQDDVIVNSASFHHQQLIAKHYMFKLQCGTVEDLIERY